MDVTVVVPTRNRSALLTMTLRSVLSQQDVDLEVIVVDEASTDETPSVLAAIGDDRVRVIRHDTPRGTGAARNHGAAEARADWVAFLDDDDLWAPDKLACQLQAAREGRRDWAYTGAVVIDRPGRVLRTQRPLPPDKIVTELLRYYAIPGGGSNVVLKRTAWTRVGPFDTRLRNTEDWELSIRLAKHGPPACVSRPLVARRLHESNSTFDITEIVRGTQLIEALHHTTADWGKLHRWMAHSCLRARQRRAAVGQFARAALRGQARAVAFDLSALIQQRLGGATTPSSDAWIASASAWLEDFRV